MYLWKSEVSWIKHAIYIYKSESDWLPGFLCFFVCVVVCMLLGDGGLLLCSRGRFLFGQF
jgi:hypothetical protein